MTANQASNVNDLLRWFFADEASRYENAEVLRLTGATINDINNWVRREMIAPDETTPGRRIYLPLTVADIKVATILTEMNVTAAMALMAGRVINHVTMSWFAGRDWEEGDKLPSFKRDIRQHFAVMWWGSSKLYTEPRRVYVKIVSRPDLAPMVTDLGPSGCTIVPIGRVWIDLADHAQRIKSRPGKRLKPEDAAEDEMVKSLQDKVEIVRRQR